MIALWLFACGSFEWPFDLSEAPVVAEDGDLPPSALLDESWPVRLAEEAELGRYASHRGWVALVTRRDYAEAVRDLGPEGKVDAARAHAEMAYLYRQAAIASARGWVAAYGDGSAERPRDVEHLLSVSYAILGRMDAARAEAAKVDADGDIAKWHAPWREWFASGAEWPPDLRDLPFTLPPPAVGQLPAVTELPHYTLVGADGEWRDVADPGALVALALWHDVAAATADAGAAAAMKVARAAYRLPVEPVPAQGREALPAELLFGSDHLTEADARFVASLGGPDRPVALVQRWAKTSPVAWLASRAMTDGRLDAARLIARADALRDDLKARADRRTGGAELSHHATFADLGALGALRSLAFLAERLGDDAAARRLEAAVTERSVKAGADPVSILALARDASARPRVEAEVGRYPSLAVVLYALDAPP